MWTVFIFQSMIILVRPILKCFNMVWFSSSIVEIRWSFWSFIFIHLYKFLYLDFNKDYIV